MTKTAIRVLLVDDDVRWAETMADILERHGCAVSVASSVRQALSAVQRTSYDVLVTDMLFDGMPEGNRLLAAMHDLHPTCALLAMTGYPAVDAAVTAMKHGAHDYLSKPIVPSELVSAIHRAQRQRRLDHENLEFGELVEILSGLVANSIERIDPYTAGHGERTRLYCTILAERIGIDQCTREKLQLAAIAHDYGKIYLEDRSFLTKSGPLTKAEYASVKEHPSLGAQKLGNHLRLKDVCRWVAEHHERWDGLGYPSRLAGTEISLPGRVLGIVEVFDSLATRRSYKPAWTLDQTVHFFRDRRGKNFDPDVTDVFLDLLDERGAEWIAQPQLDLTAAGVGEG